MTDCGLVIEFHFILFMFCQSRGKGVDGQYSLCFMGGETIIVVTEGLLYDTVIVQVQIVKVSVIGSSEITPGAWS